MIVAFLFIQQTINIGHLKPVKLVFLFMKAIIWLLMQYIKKQQQAEGHRKWKPDNIYETEYLIFYKVPPRDFEIIFEHES